MSNQLFDDSYPARSRLWYQKRQDRYGRMVPDGTPPKGVEIVLTCADCGTETSIGFSWEEVFALLNGGQVQGMVPVPAGWRGQVFCQKPGCQNMQGRTVLTYNLHYDDLRRHADNLQAGRRASPPQGPPQGGGMGGGGPLGGGGLGGPWY